VPTGMKVGVSTMPWARLMRPRRAAPSAARSSKFIYWRPSGNWRWHATARHGVKTRANGFPD